MMPPPQAGRPDGVSDNRAAPANSSRRPCPSSSSPQQSTGSLRALEPTQPTRNSKPFKDYDPGFIHIDVKYLPQMPDESARRYLFVAIDRATRWVFAQIRPAIRGAGSRPARHT